MCLTEVMLYAIGYGWLRMHSDLFEKRMRESFDFISKEIDDKDRQLFGFNLETDNIQELPDNFILAHIMKEVGIFTSVGDARKNGWNKEIPEGFSYYTVGKKKHNVFILKTGKWQV